MSGDVGGLHCGVVMGSAPVFPPKCDLALDDGEGGRHKDVSRKWVNQTVESVEVGSWDTSPRPSGRCLARPMHSAQASFLNKLGQQSVAMFAHAARAGTWASGNGHPGARASLVWVECALSC